MLYIEQFTSLVLKKYLFIKFGYFIGNKKSTGIAYGLNGIVLGFYNSYPLLNISFIFFLFRLSFFFVFVYFKQFFFMNLNFFFTKKKTRSSLLTSDPSINILYDVSNTKKNSIDKDLKFDENDTEVSDELSHSPTYVFKFFLKRCSFFLKHIFFVNNDIVNDELTKDRKKNPLNPFLKDLTFINHWVGGLASNKVYRNFNEVITFPMLIVFGSDGFINCGLYEARILRIPSVGLTNLSRGFVYTYNIVGHVEYVTSRLFLGYCLISLIMHTIKAHIIRFLNKFLFNDDCVMGGSSLLLDETDFTQFWHNVRLYIKVLMMGKRLFFESGKKMVDNFYFEIHNSRMILERKLKKKFLKIIKVSLIHKLFKSKIFLHNFFRKIVLREARRVIILAKRARAEKEKEIYKKLRPWRLLMSKVRFDFFFFLASVKFFRSFSHKKSQLFLKMSQRFNKSKAPISKYARRIYYSCLVYFLNLVRKRYAHTVQTKLLVRSFLNSISKYKQRVFFKKSSHRGLILKKQYKFLLKRFVLKKKNRNKQQEKLVLVNSSIQKNKRKKEKSINRSYVEVYLKAAGLLKKPMEYVKRKQQDGKKIGKFIK